MKALRAKDMQRLVGRTITAVKSGAFPDGRGGITYNPVFTLDDGSRLTFSVAETEGGEYGIDVTRHS